MCPASPCRNTVTKNELKRYFVSDQRKCPKIDTHVSIPRFRYGWFRFCGVHAGRTIKFACKKSLDPPKFSLELLFPDSIFLCSYFGAVEWIHKSPSAIFNQPMFPTKISTALFEKKSERRSPRGLFVCLYGWDVVKCREFEGKIR